MSGKKPSHSRSAAASDSEHEGCSNCSHLTEVVESLRREVKELKEALAKPDVTVANQQSELDEWKKEVEKKIDENRERIESRTNRQLRQTLVFRHIPEVKENEKSWDDVKDVLAGKISSLLGVDQEDAKGMINRCHRGGDPKYYDSSKGKHRPIYANMYRWDECEAITRKSRARDSGVNCDS